MPLRSYGLLTGTLVNHGPQGGGNPHYLLSVKAGTVTYRVSLNVTASRTSRAAPLSLQFQVIDIGAKGTPKAKRLAADLRARFKQGDGLVLASEGAPTLDFVRGGIIDINGFKKAQPDAVRELARLAKAAAGTAGAFVAAFGTGFPDQDDRPFAGTSSLASRDPRRSSFGFDGLDNLHMNQGSFLRVGNHLDRHFGENGPNQDGAVLFFIGNQVTGIFAKFESQAFETDQNGNPVATGVAALDAVPARTRAIVAPPNRFARLARSTAAKAASANVTRASVAQSVGTRVFADPTPADPTRPFKPDNDDDVRNSPFVANIAQHGVPEVVPTPRGGVYPLMNLADVLDKGAVAAIKATGQIVLHMVGDTGAPASVKLKGEDSVADLMTQDLLGSPKAARPAFLFHLGDVVYYYGEEEYYYDQFYKPFKDYAAPIFAIPGNHDGITYRQDMVSLEGFIAAFCDAAPSHWSGAGGIGRSTMTQPAVYFTLDAPFLSIIGLYSNCAETNGFLDDQQKLFLFKELQRLKALRDGGEFRAVLLAVHHPPVSFSPQKPSSVRMGNDIDTACKQANLWPDAVLSGHAHLYQRITRTLGSGDAAVQIPYLISGAGGYDANLKQELDKTEFAQLDLSDPGAKLHCVLAKYGFLRVTVTVGTKSQPPTLRFEYLSPDINGGQKPADVCVVDLDHHRLMT